MPAGMIITRSVQGYCKYIQYYLWNVDGYSKLLGGCYFFIWTEKLHKKYISLKTCRLDSFLRNRGEIFVKFKLSGILELFTENDPVSWNWSGFKSGDSYIYQLLEITLKINNSFVEWFETRGVFLRLLKTCHNIWHKVVSDELFHLLQNFFKSLN